MNNVALIGRLVADPDIKYSNNGDKQLCIARFTLAVDRQFKRDTEQGADFIKCVSFGQRGEFVEKYFTKGLKVAITGRIQTGSYENRDGQTVYTTDIVVENQEFVEKKQTQTPPQAEPKESSEIFHIPEDADDSGLPFNV